MRIWLATIIYAGCFATARAAEFEHAARALGAVLAWLVGLREGTLALLFSHANTRLLSAPSNVFDRFSPHPSIASSLRDSQGTPHGDSPLVPRLHFVASGPGGVLPDFEGPLAVDAIYRNKHWGGAAYYAVWTGYYGNQKLAIGVDAHTSYESICEFLAANSHVRSHQLTWPVAQKAGWYLRSAWRLYEHLVHTLIKQLIIASERCVHVEHATRVFGSAYCAACTALGYWMHWTLRWNTARGVYMLLARRKHSSMRPRASRSTLAELVPKGPLHYSLCLVEAAAAVAFTTPAAVARACVSVAPLASVPMSAHVLRPVYASHRLAVLERCTGMRGHV